MGFVAGTDCETAVCMPAGARLSLQGINETVQRAFSIGAAEDVTMTRLEVTGHAHRDAVRFANGREVLLQSLNAGVTCTLAPPRRRELAPLGVPLGMLVVPIAHEFVQAAAVHAARLAARLLDEVTNECGA
jgi:hypothetical protein